MYRKMLFMALVLFSLLFSEMAGHGFADASAQLEQGRQLVKDGQYSQAEAIYIQILTDYPGSDDAFEAQKGLTILYIAWDKPRQADSALQQLLSNFPKRKDLPQAINKIAGTFGMKLKDYDRSRQLHQYVLDHYPAHEQAMWAKRGLAFADIHTGNYASAEAAIEKLLTDYPNHPGLAKAFHWLGNDYRRVERYQRARELYQYVLDNWPGADIAVWSQQGVAVCSIQIGDEQAADAALGRLLLNFSSHKHIAKALNKIANYYYQSKKYKKARQIYQHVANNWPKSKQAIWSQKKVVLLSIQLGEEAAAKSAIEKMTTQFSGHEHIAKVVTGIANEYQKRFKKHGKSREIYQSVVDNWP